MSTHSTIHIVHYVADDHEIRGFKLRAAGMMAAFLDEDSANAVIEVYESSREFADKIRPAYAEYEKAIDKEPFRMMRDEEYVQWIAKEINNGDPHVIAGVDVYLRCTGVTWMVRQIPLMDRGAVGRAYRLRELVQQGRDQTGNDKSADPKIRDGYWQTQKETAAAMKFLIDCFGGDTYDPRITLYRK
jgi:hypothetical protein